MKYRFSVLTLLSIVAACAGMLGLLTHGMSESRRHRNAIALLLEAGASVTTATDNVDLDSLPDWSLASFFTDTPVEIEGVAFADYYDTPRSHQVASLLALLPELKEVTVHEPGWWDDRCAESLVGLQQLTSALIDAGPALTSQGVANSVRPNLESLWVYRADLAGLEDQSIAWPATLRTIWLEDCTNLSTRAFAELLHSTQVDTIFVDGHAMYDPENMEPSAWHSMDLIVIENCHHLSASGLSKLLPQQLDGLTLTEPASLDSDLVRLHLPPALRQLRISGNTKLSNASVLQVVEKCPKLTRLTIAGSQIDDGACAALSRLKDCKWMDLRGTSISSEAAAQLTRAFNGACTIHAGKIPTK